MEIGSKINSITLCYAAILKLCVCLTDIEVQKIDRCILLIYDMVLANIQLEDK